MNSRASFQGKRPRVVVAKAGLDGHDRGAKVIARAFRDAGMEVIYAGLRRSPSELAETVLQEDAQVLGLSILSGAAVPLTRRIAEALHERGIDDVLLLVGGIASPAAVQELKTLGVAEVFGPGSSIADIVRFTNDWLERTGHAIPLGAS